MFQQVHDGPSHDGQPLNRALAKLVWKVLIRLKCIQRALTGLDCNRMALWRRQETGNVVLGEADNSNLWVKQITAIFAAAARVAIAKRHTEQLAKLDKSQDTAGHIIPHC